MAAGGSTGTAAEYLPAQPTLERMREAVQACRGCSLYEQATRAVFGEGPARARLAMVGEQPGDQEDRVGQPFVGPAGQLLSRAMASAGLNREAVYVTNAVKHFKWEPRGKRRLHKKPSQGELIACRPWLEQELREVTPELLVCLGVSAASAVFGRSVRLSDYRGRFVPSPLAEATLITVHPSALLRLRGGEARETEMARFVRDLEMVGKYLARRRAGDAGPDRR